LLSLRRTRPCGFGQRERVGPRPEHPYGPDLAESAGGAPSDFEGRNLYTAFAGDGRPVLTWSPPQTLGLLNWAQAGVTTFGGDVQTFGGPLRDADSITPVILADGTPAVAWSDVSDGGDPHLHLAIEGVPETPDPPAPRVHLGRVEQIRGGLALPFRCSAACDVRAAVPGGSGGRRSLRAAGSGRLKIQHITDPIVLARPDSVPVHVFTGPSGGRVGRAHTLIARLRVPRLPRVLGLKAVRRGNRVRVTWHSDRGLTDATVIATPTRTRAQYDPFGGLVIGEGQRRFHLSLEASRGDRYVQLYLVYNPDATIRRIAVVRITG
jgi:hypothetical protein